MDKTNKGRPIIVEHRNGSVSKASRKVHVPTGTRTAPDKEVMRIAREEMERNHDLGVLLAR